jgi:hypothetical protein
VDTLQQGSIIWAWMVDRHGRNPKCRAGIIITVSEDIRSGTDLVVVAIASEPDKESLGPSVKLPWHRSGHPRTRLKQPCYAICHWLAPVAVEDIVDVGGYVSGPLLRDILENLPPEFRSSE